MKARLGRVPAPLAAWLMIVVVLGLAWQLVLPPLQAPDEQSHVAYVQKIVDAGVLPWSTGRTLDRSDPAASSLELRSAALYAGLTPLLGNPAARPLWTGADEALWRGVARRLPAGSRSDGGIASTFHNPPLYYLYASVPYLIGSGSSIFTRIYVTRLANLSLLMAIVIFTWLLAGELLGGRIWVRSVATGVVALHPMLTNIAAGVTPDLALAALFTAGLYVAVRIAGEGPRPVLLGWALGLMAAAALTQGRGLPLVFPLAVAVALGWHARRTPGRIASQALVGSGVLASLAVLVGLLEYATRGDMTASRIRQFGSYVWQFYLPRVGSMGPPIFPGWGVRNVFIDRFFGGWAQLEVTLPSDVLDWLSWGARGGLVLLVVALWRQRAAVRARGRQTAVLLVALACTLLLLHGVAFRELLVSGSDPVITGRYLLPLISLFGVGIALALEALPRRAELVVGSVVLAAATVLQLTALGLVGARFYA